MHVFVVKCVDDKNKCLIRPLEGRALGRPGALIIDSSLGERAFVGRLSLGIALSPPPIYNEASVIA